MTAPSIETVSLAVCPICRGTSLHTVETVPDAYIPLLVLQQCDSCGVIFLNPRLTEAAVVAVENASEVYVMGAEETEQVISDPLTRMASYLSSFVRSPGRRWLDIGCNAGLLLEAVRRQGWQPVGVEIATEPAQRARDHYGLTVYNRLEEIEHEAPFDMITAWHVLEHTTYPVDFLRAASRKLASGGVLAMQVPAYEMREQFAERGQLSSLICSVHNFYFTLESLRSLLASTGLQVIDISTDPQSLLLTAICSNRRPDVSWRERLHRLLRRR